MQIWVIAVLFLSFFEVSFSRPSNPNNPCPGVKFNFGEYVMDLIEEPSRFCCKCNAGTYLNKACRVGNPASTRCTPCEFDPLDSERQFYMDEGPHLHRKCKKAAGTCRSGYMRLSGSTKKPARCVPYHVFLQDANNSHEQ